MTNPTLNVCALWKTKDMAFCLIVTIFLATQIQKIVVFDLGANLDDTKLKYQDINVNLL